MNTTEAFTTVCGAANDREAALLKELQGVTEHRDDLLERHGILMRRNRQLEQRVTELLAEVHQLSREGKGITPTGGAAHPAPSARETTS